MREAFDATEIFPANLSLSALVADAKKRTLPESSIWCVFRDRPCAEPRTTLRLEARHPEARYPADGRPSGGGPADGRPSGGGPADGRPPDGGRDTRRIGVLTHQLHMRSGQLDPIARRDIFGPKRRTAAGAGAGCVSENPQRRALPPCASPPCT